MGSQRGIVTMLLHAFSLVATATLVMCTPEIFDYVIIGGGPAGLVLANRLSNDPGITVAVVEAGDSAYNNPNVTNLPASIADGFIGLGTSIDWQYKSAPQKYTNDRVLGLSAGKALGGTTTINGMTYLRAEREQIDAWEELGNDGWNWAGLWPYYLEQEGFHMPTEEQQEHGATFERDAHSFEGDVATGWSKYFPTQNFSQVLKEASQAIGLPFNADANKGRMRGYNVWPSTLNATSGTRADAARSYYYPVAEERPNLHVFLNMTATRIIWKDCDSSKDAVAQGVEGVTSANATITIEAKEEVIVSAGSLRSPALLEHSGVGNPGILKSLAINTVIDLPSVGSKLEDQPNIAIAYVSSVNWTGYPTYVTYPTAADLFGDQLSSLADEVYANISSYASTILSDLFPGSTTIENIEKHLKLQADVIFKPNSTVPLAELVWFPTGNQIAVAFWNLLPFARGEVHINSSNPLEQPVINANFFQFPIDQYVQAAATILIRKYFATVPLSDVAVAELTPNLTLVPKEANNDFRDERWGTWMKSVYGSNSHPLGTCSMMAKDLGGVVDAQGKVYGSQNVRVVDASIMPMQVSGHLSANVYAIALKIADGIMKGREKRAKQQA
ncbi:hypothetical protein BDV96DRAFT_568981 [Lophiotrema nucula]|uniref:Glucose-methanol-choline oxidoreductase N-terminal domain-containing protein n=1 Tax=Lophiotrema nucula TaxID=690887 RepID=A0A6A5ZHN4_9PLEO|nr:hypothetical protein BDV96DRAFT_568981 [Lophiotrema nucula]